jgi:hypothetical protein
MVEVLQMAQSCTNCGDSLQAYTKLAVVPKFYALDMSASNAQVNVDHSIEVPIEDGARHMLFLTGIIYYGEHFTSCIIDSKGCVWYHEGIETSSDCIQEGNLSHLSPQTVRKAYQRKVTVAIYADL